MRRAAGISLLVLVAAAIVLAWSRPGGPSVSLGESTPLPRADGTCAALAHRGAARELVPGNAAANATTPSGPLRWSMDPDTVRWTRWVQMRSRVTGDFTGTTDQILRWAACKWDLDADVLRAVASQESGWHAGMVGDHGQSFGLMQVKDHYADGSPAWGGYPDTLVHTAVNVDLYAAYQRACLDGVFDDGGPWLYDGRSVAYLAREHGAQYVLWGCVGSWFSGHWYDPAAQGYIARVRHRYENRLWPHG